MRVRRFLWLWCAALVLAAMGGLGSFGGSARALLVVGPPPGADEPAEEEPLTTVASEVPAVIQAPALLPPPGTPTSTTAVAEEGPEPTIRHATPPSTASAPPPPPPAPDAEGVIPCDVKAGESVPTAGGLGPGVPLYVDNCRPITGDTVGIYAYGGYPGMAVRVAFGDGTFAGDNPASTSCVPTRGQVEAQHRYPTPGRRLVEATTWYPCHDTPPKVVKVWVEVAPGRVPEVLGAAPCRGLGPVMPGDPARQGIGTRQVSTPRLPDLQVRLGRCSVPLGGQSEISLDWYQAAAWVDWGDGSKPVAIGAKGQQGATSIHTHATRGLHVVTVVVLDHEGKPIPPVTFTMQVT